MNTGKSTQKMMKIALLGTAGAVLMLLQYPFPGAPFLKFEISNVPVLIGGFALGPFAGLSVLLLKNLLFILLRFSADELVGVPMNTIASGIFVLVSAYVYLLQKTMKGAFIALSAGIIAMTVFMIPINYFIVPLYMHWLYPQNMAASGLSLLRLIIFSVIPFNLVQGVINGLLTFLIYKRVSSFIRFGEEKVTAI